MANHVRGELSCPYVKIANLPLSDPIRNIGKVNDWTRIKNKAGLHSRDWAEAAEGRTRAASSVNPSGGNDEHTNHRD